jgi:radical SAM superfamily enzyme YgiQ (UPF0313 family)
MKILYLPNQHSQQRQHEKPVWIYPVLMAMEAEYYRQRGHYVQWDYPFPMGIDKGAWDKIISEPEGLPFLDLPSPDRIFTRAMDPKYQAYGNYKYLPATHMMAARDCWYAKCTFCEWAKKYPKVETRSIKSVIEEMKQIQAQGFREVFDDSGTFPVGAWLTEFCIKKFFANGLRDFVISCNMRIGAGADFKLMKQAGFRMVLFGVESANQSTLNKLNKGVNANEIIKDVKKAAYEGLEPHIAVMFGYPWESEAEERKTLTLVHYLLRKGYAKTAQASLYRVPGETPIDRGNVKRIYNVACNAEFWIRKLNDVRSWADFTYLLKAIKKGVKRD